MCGISAFIGNNAIVKILESLKQLQNRGYDSAGICTISESLFANYKYASTESTNALKKLQEITNQIKSTNIGIGHTRWATHGAKTDENSHPHLSMNNEFAIVHNGIIENYLDLKEELLQKGYSFKSQTDSEVIVNLLEEIYRQKINENGVDNTSIQEKVIESIQTLITRLEGTWGLTIMCLETPNTLYCTRRGSPLLISKNDTFAMIVSEQSGFCNYAQNYIVLDNDDICQLDRKINENENTEIEMKIISNKVYDVKNTNIQNQELSPEPYPHWTIKEIHEQVDSSLRAISMGARVLSNNKVKLGGLERHTEELIDIENLILLGCGTSRHAGMVSRYYFKDLCHFNTVQVYDGAEFDSSDIPQSGKTGIIFLSQSGETKDLHRCIEIGKEADCILIGVVNVPDSMISREVHCGCYLNAGKEVSVASTKAFTSQIIILSMIAIWFSQQKNINNSKRINYVKSLRKLYLDIETTLNISENTINDTILELLDKNSCFILGKGIGQAIALEGSLKIKEIAYIHCEGYSSSSLKHGPFALLEEEFPVLLLDIQPKYRSKILNAYEEIKSRKANIVVITDQRKENITNQIVIPKNEYYNGILATIVLQLIAYKLSIKRGYNPDMPRNLAKVVTVE